MLAIDETDRASILSCCRTSLAHSNLESRMILSKREILKIAVTLSSTASENLCEGTPRATVLDYCGKLKLCLAHAERTRSERRCGAALCIHRNIRQDRGDEVNQAHWIAEVAPRPKPGDL